MKSFSLPELKFPFPDWRKKLFSNKSSNHIFPNAQNPYQDDWTDECNRVLKHPNGDIRILVGLCIRVTGAGREDIMAQTYNIHNLLAEKNEEGGSKEITRGPASQLFEQIYEYLKEYLLTKVYGGVEYFSPDTDSYATKRIEHYLTRWVNNRCLTKQFEDVSFDVDFKARFMTEADECKFFSPEEIVERYPHPALELN